MGNKTIPVFNVIDNINSKLASRNFNRDQREVLCTLAEEILFETGNYKGFRYLNRYDLDSDIIPGVRVDEHGKLLPEEERFKHTDEYRRQY